MRSELRRFRGKNALSFASFDIPLYGQGLVFVRGENLDEGGSNGSGKSTLFELLYYLFYDKLTKTDRRLKKTNILNVHKPKDFLLRLDMDSDGSNYTIDKFRSHSKFGTGASITRNDEVITPDDPREAQKAIARLTGLTSNEYLGRVYLSQKYTHMMIEGTPAQKKEYISRCFGLDTLDVMVKEVTKRINAVPLPDETHLKSLLSNIEQDLVLLGNAEELQNQLQTFKAQQEALQDNLLTLKVELANQQKAEAIDSQWKLLKKELHARMSLDMDPSVVGDRIKSARKSLSFKRNQIAALDKRLRLEAKLASEAAGLTSAEGGAERLDIITAKISKLERNLPGVERRVKLQTSLDKIPEDTLGLHDLKSKLEKWTQRKEDVQAKLQSVTAEIKKLTSVGDVCHTCLRPVSAHDKETMLSERKASLEKLQTAEGKAKEAVSSFSSRVSDLQRRADLLSQLEDLPDGDAERMRRTLDELHAEQKELQSNLTKLALIASLREQLAELPEVDQDKSEIELEIGTLESDLDFLEEAHSFLLRNEGLEFDVHALQRATLAVNGLSTQLSTASSAVLEAQDKYSKHLLLSKQKTEIESKLNAASVEKQRHRVLKYVNVSLEELKKLSLRESTQLLSKILPVYLTQLFPQGEVKLGLSDDSDGFDLVFNKGGGSIPLTLISGGQAKRVGIAIVFSFAKMGRNTTNILICDEPFRDLDQKGREACLELIRDFDLGESGTVLVTSHDHDMDATRKYDQVWTVQMKNHVSRLYLEG